MNAIQTLHNFWNGFGLPAYDETDVPDDAQLPYITYEVSNDYFGGVLAQAASVWYRSSSWVAVTEKEQQIADYIGRGGRMVAFDGGAFWIKRGEPWAQRMGDPDDDMIRRIALNIEIEFLT